MVPDQQNMLWEWILVYNALEIFIVVIGMKIQLAMIKFVTLPVELRKSNTISVNPWSLFRGLVHEEVKQTTSTCESSTLLNNLIPFFIISVCSS